MQLKRHYEFLTQMAPGHQVNRSRFWTYYMRGVHGDMDTRYESKTTAVSRRARASSLPPRSRTSSGRARASSVGLRFRPELSNTYGFNPKEWEAEYAAAAQYEPETKPSKPLADLLPSRPSYLDKLKALDEPSFSVPSRYLNNHPLGLEVGGLLNGAEAPEVPQEPAGPSAEEAKSALEILRKFLDFRASTSELALFDALKEIDVFVRSSYRHESRYSFQRSMQVTSKRVHKTVQQVVTTEG